MATDLELHGMFEHNRTFDYSDYEYEDDCITKRSFMAIFIPILYSVALVLGFMGNVLVLVVMWKKWCNWSVTDAFILHLSIADLLLLITMPLWAADAVIGWHFSTGLCKLAGSLFKINFYCGVFLLACISLDLYFSVVHAFQLFSRTKRWLVQLICLAVWLFCIILSIPDWLYLKAKRDHEQVHYNLECVHEYPSHAKRVASHMPYLVSFPSLLLLVLGLLCCYFLRRPDQCRKKHKAMKVILVLILAFFFSWTPYSIAVLVDTIKPTYSKSTVHCDGHIWTAVKSTTVLGFLHSCFKPLIYFGFSEKFRQWVLTILKCQCSCAEASGDFFPWDCSEIDNAASVPQEEKGSLHPMSDTVKTITRQQNDSEIV